MTGDLQFVSDARGNVTGVIVPIELWRELQAKPEIARLIRNFQARQRGGVDDPDEAHLPAAKSEEG